MKRKIVFLASGEQVAWGGNRYGFVLVYSGKDEYDRPCYEIRKPSPAQREEMVYFFIREHDGESITIGPLAKKLGMSDRSLQSLLRKMEKEGRISVERGYTPFGRQSGNIYHVLKAPPSLHQITIEKLYMPSNPCGIRTWSWDDYKMGGGKDPEELYEQLEELNEERDRLKGKKEEDTAKESKFAEKAGFEVDGDGRITGFSGKK